MKKTKEIKVRRSYKGSGNPNWKNGIRMDSDGYLYIKTENHPLSDNDNRVPQHRLIYENYLSILFDEEMFIPKIFEIHHIDGNRQNNSLINLELLTHKEHRFKHRQDRSNFVCLICKSNKTYNEKNNWPHWYHYENGIICKKCFIYLQKNRN